MLKLKNKYFYALLVFISYASFSITSSLLLKPADAIEINTGTRIGSTTYIHAEAEFVPIAEFTSNEINNFISSFYRSQHYSIDNNDIYILDKSREVVMVSCAMRNKEFKHIQYIQKASLNGGCPLIENADKFDEAKEISSDAKLKDGAFVEVSVIHI